MATLDLGKVTGEDGVTPNLQAGTATSLAAGSPPTVTRRAGSPDATPIFDFGIPAGAVGTTPNITIGTVTTGAAGSSASASMTGTPAAPVLNMTIPRGDTGAQGAQGDAPAGETVLTQSATLALSHGNRLLIVNASSDIVITVPTHASAAFPDNTEVEVLRYGTGNVTFAADSGVSLVCAGSDKKISAQYQSGCLKLLTGVDAGNNTWVLQGAVE